MGHAEVILPGIAFARVACAEARLLFEFGRETEGLRPSRNGQVAQGRVGGELVKIWDNPDSRERDGPLKWHEH